MVEQGVVDERLFADYHPCPYLPGQIASLPLRRPAAPLTPAALDEALARGDRRSGPFLYRPSCRVCRACEPLRVVVSRFQPSATQRRVWRKGNAALDVEIGPPVVDAEHVELFNRHREGRGLGGGELAADEYASFLVDTCCPTIELRYRLARQLIAVAICDRGRESLSAVYCYFDPAFQTWSPGTFSILKQIECCQHWNLRFLYLGLFVAACRHLSYKARFRPHERLIGGRWQESRAV